MKFILDRDNLAPIALFVYERIDPLRQVIEALKCNKLATESDLFIYSDGPRQGYNEDKITEVRKFIKTIDGFKSISIIERDNNLGLAKSCTTGISELTKQFGQIIFVEDDTLTAPQFIQFLNYGLQMYRDHPQVISICANSFPVASPMPETFFLQMTHSWGFATWQRAWSLFSPDANMALQELRRRKLLRRYNNASSLIIPNSRILQKTALGEIDSWHMMWRSIPVLKDMYSLFPGHSLARNVGFGSGTNCRVKADIFKEDLYPKEIVPDYIEEIIEDPGFVRKVKRYYLRQHLRLLFNFLTGYLQQYNK